MFKNLKIHKPIAFIDVETTGLRPKLDRIIELSILKVFPDGVYEYKNHRINPEVPIPVDATRYNDDEPNNQREKGNSI